VSHIGLLLLAAIVVAVPVMPVAEEKDPFLWLQDVTGEKALSWVKEQNATSTAELTKGPEFKELNDRHSDCRHPYFTVSTLHRRTTSSMLQPDPSHLHAMSHPPHRTDCEYSFRLVLEESNSELLAGHIQTPRS
jgi:hypothetical protein